MPYCENYPCGSLLCNWYGCLRPHMRDRTRVVIGSLVVAVAMFVSTSAQAVAYDCPTIRSYVVQYGKARAIAWALHNGYTWAEIVRIQRQCTGR